MRTSSVAILSLALAATLAVDAAPPASVDPSVIPGYRLLSPSLAVGGLLSKEALAQLEPWGVRTVIDLRTPAEGTEAEAEAVRSMGIRYVSIPISSGTLGWPAAKTLRRALDAEGAAPVLLHCRSGSRVSAMMVLVSRLRGKSVEESLAVGRSAGLPAALEAPIRQIAESPQP